MSILLWRRRCAILVRRRMATVMGGRRWVLVVTALLGWSILLMSVALRGRLSVWRLMALRRRIVAWGWGTLLLVISALLRRGILLLTVALGRRWLTVRRLIAALGRIGRLLPVALGRRGFYDGIRSCWSSSLRGVLSDDAGHLRP
jgi:hypothetical protein